MERNYIMKRMNPGKLKKVKKSLIISMMEKLWIILKNQGKSKMLLYQEKNII